MELLQLAILRALLSKDNWDTLSSVIDGKMFETPEAGRLFAIIEAMHKDTLDDITLQELTFHIYATYKIQTDYRDKLVDIVESMEDVEVGDVGALKRMVKRFHSRNLSLKAVEYMGAHIDDEDYDPSVPGGMLAAAAEMSVSFDADVLDYSTALPPDEIKRTGVVGFGFSEKFDGFLDGGKGPGELSLYVALSGVGKTSMLILDAANAAKFVHNPRTGERGMNTLYITKEIRASKCVQRFDQCFTGMDKYEMTANPDAVKRARERVPGKIWIKDWSHTKTTVSDIRSLIFQMRQRGDIVDYLVVDYMELIESEVYNKNQPRFNFTSVCKDLRALANELQIPVASAWQAKRLAMGKHYLEKDDIGEDWGIVKNADILVGLNQNPQELRDKIMRVNIIKQRESTNRSTMNLYADLDRMVVKEHSSHEEQEVVDGTA